MSVILGNGVMGHWVTGARRYESVVFLSPRAKYSWIIDISILEDETATLSRNVGHQYRVHGNNKIVLLPCTLYFISDNSD